MATSRITQQRIAPAEFQKLVPSPSDPICEIFKKFRLFQILYWRWYRGRFSEDLELSPAYAAELCYARQHYCSGALGDPLHLINAGARDVTLIPPKPSELKALIPTLESPFCEAFVPGIIQWMQRVTDAVGAEYSETKEFTPEFASKLCALDCISNGSGSGGGGGGGSTCPVVTVTGTAKSRDTHVLLTFTCLLAESGYAYILYRNGVSIATGTTVGNVVTYNDTGLVNDTAYTYLLTVQKPTCAVYSGTVVGTPRQCQTYNLQLLAISETQAAITASIFDLNGELQPGSTWELYMALAGQEPGALISQGVVGTDGVCSPNQYPGVCWNGLVAAFAGQNCTVTAVVKQGTCAAYTFSASVRVKAYPLARPVVSITRAGLVSWGQIPGALYYDVYAALPDGNCQGETPGELAYKFTTRNLSFSVVPPLGITQMLTGGIQSGDAGGGVSGGHGVPGGGVQPHGYRTWLIYVIARSANSESDASLVTVSRVQAYGTCGQ